MDPRAVLLVAMLLLSGCLQPGGDEKEASAPAPDADPAGEGADEGGNLSSQSFFWPVAEESEGEWGERIWVFHGVDRREDGGCVEDGDRLEVTEGTEWSDAEQLVRLPEPGCFVEGDLQVDTEAEKLWISLRLVLKDEPGDAEEGRLRIEDGKSGSSGNSVSTNYRAAWTSGLWTWDGQLNVKIVSDEENVGAVYLDTITLKEPRPVDSETKWVVDGRDFEN